METDINKKPLKIMVACCILTEVDGQAYGSHIVHAFRMGRDTNCEFFFFSPRRMAIDNARNAAVRAAISNDCDYLFFYDDDMDLHKDTFKTLLSRDKDIIMALCHIRGFPFDPMIFRWVDVKDFDFSVADIGHKDKAMQIWSNYKESVGDDGVLNDVATVGNACTLIKVDLLRKMDFPWFYTGTANTEDVYFCCKAKDKFPDVSICVDTTVPAGHYLKDKRMLHPDNAEFLKKQEEELVDFVNDLQKDKLKAQEEKEVSNG